MRKYCIYGERRICMRKYVSAIALTALVVTVATGRAQPTERDELQARVGHINDVAKQHGRMKEVVHAISIETGVPTGRVEAMHKDNPDAGVGGIFVACVMADLTAAKPERFLNARLSGKGWAAIARDNRVPVDQLNARLDRLE